MYPKKTILILIFLLAAGSSAFAQRTSNRFSEAFRNRMEFGGQVGTSHYIGELEKGIYGNQLFSAGISSKFHFNRIEDRDRTWGLRLDVNYSQIEGSGPAPNAPMSSDPNDHLSFTNNLWEAAVMGEFHFWDFRPYRGSPLMSPYVFAGVGGIFHNPKSEHPSGGSTVSLINQLVELKNPEYGTDPLGNDALTGFQKERKWVVGIPFGAGVKYNFTGPLSVALEVNYRYVFSDFLDGIGSKEYLDYDKIKDKLPTNPQLPHDPQLTKTDWEALVAPATKSGSLNYADLMGRPRGHKGNDFFMTTVLKATWTFYRYRDPSWK